MADTSTPPSTSPGASTLDQWQSQLSALQQDLNDVTATLQFDEGQYQANHFGGQTPGQFASIIAPFQAKQASDQAAIANLQNEIANAVQPPLSSVAAAATAQNNAALAALSNPGDILNANSPLFIPVAGGSSPSIFSSPTFLIGLAAAAVAVWWVFFRKKRS